MKINKNIFYILITLLILAIASFSLTILIKTVYPELSTWASNFSFGDWDSSQFSGMPNYFTLTSVEKFLYIAHSSWFYSFIFYHSLLLVFFIILCQFNIKNVFRIGISILFFVSIFVITYITKNFIYFFILAFFIPFCISFVFLFKKKLLFYYFIASIFLFSVLVYIGLFHFITAFIILLFLSCFVFFLFSIIKKKIKLFFLRTTYIVIILLASILINMPFFLSIIEYSSYSSLTFQRFYDKNISIKSFNINYFSFVNNNFNKETFNRPKNEKYDDFRVLNIGTFQKINNNTKTKKSICGNSDFPLTRYKNLFYNYLINNTGEINYVKNIVFSAKLNKLSQEQINDVFLKQGKTNILNMLNLANIYYDSDSLPMINKRANKNAWFIDSCLFVKEDNELYALRHFDAKKTAIISYQYENLILKEELKNRDTNAKIDLIIHEDNFIEYKYSSNSNQLAIFSEIYYPKGWTVTINYENSKFFRANYLLRAMYLPKGDYIIRFTFESIPNKIGNIISLSTIICIFLLYFYYFIRRKMLKTKH